MHLLGCHTGQVTPTRALQRQFRNHGASLAISTDKERKETAKAKRREMKREMKREMRTARRREMRTARRREMRTARKRVGGRGGVR
ncbi:hypothetical protein OG588_43380 [Streptomyces prunicolor]|uniref:hypothetical protein n=1 Tax=Streptomyces prunicolor TaxID=67348 RepID=UPI0038669383|nr:hypothetical protein OG588_43380 [Streptomyces prunicolor]